MRIGRTTILNENNWSLYYPYRTTLVTNHPFLFGSVSKAELYNDSFKYLLNGACFKLKTR